MPRSYYYINKGITVYDEWLTDFQAFYEYIGSRPTPKHSLDRIDNDGNYEPGNVRWATKSQQSINRTMNNKYGHTGIKLTKSVHKGDRWEAYIGAVNSLIYLGTFDSKEEAIEARVKAELIYHI